VSRQLEASLRQREVPRRRRNSQRGRSRASAARWRGDQFRTWDSTWRRLIAVAILGGVWMLLHRTGSPRSAAMVDFRRLR
jgi:hypothetical protein